MLRLDKPSRLIQKYSDPTSMIFDRILEDALGFIRRFLWWRSNKTESIRQPFQSMRVIHGESGIISLVEGRDTPRAVRSWIYSPKRLDLNSAKPVVRKPSDDLHIYLDFLGPLLGLETPSAKQERQERQLKRRLGEKVPTHRLQVLRASHFLNEHGFYNYELIYWEDFDFYWPTGQQPEFLARIATDKLAHHCLNQANVFELSAEDWANLLQSIWQEIRA
jgi:hypothetical protein